MWKQSPKQSVYDIRLHTKKPATKNYDGAIGGAPPPPPLDPPLLTNERMVRGRKGPGYLEQKFHGMNGPGNE